MNDKSKPLHDDIRDIRNDIERIKGDTHHINRIMTMANQETIVTDLTKIIGSSERKVAALYYTRQQILASDLAEKLGQDPRNLTKFIKDFLIKGYISELRLGKNKAFVRSEVLDLIGFETSDEFSGMLSSWLKTNSS